MLGIIKVQIYEIFIATILVVVVFIRIVAGEENTSYPQWKGTVEIHNGISIVKNSQDPAFGTCALQLMEDLSIGQEDDKNLLFYKIRDVKADAAGNIYILDSGNYRVQVFDRNGQFLRTIGRYGQGPGEFQLPTRIKIEAKTKRLFVRDVPNRIIVFEENGIPTMNIFLSGLDDFQPLADGAIVAITKYISTPDLSSRQVLCRVDQKGKISDRYADTLHTIFVPKQSGGTIAFITGFELSLFLAPLDAMSIVYGYSSIYELIILDNKGRILRRLTMNAPAPLFTPEEKKSFGRIPAPAQKPYFFSIMTDPLGRIYVQRNQSQEIIRGRGPVDTKLKEVDVFSKEGYFLFRTRLPPNTCAIGEEVIYLYTLNEENGEEFVRRMRIKNWSDLPLGSAINK